MLTILWLWSVSGVEDEEDFSCPPDLEEVSESVQAQPDLDNDVAAVQAAAAAANGGPVVFNQNIVRELTLAIKVSERHNQSISAIRHNFMCSYFCKQNCEGEGVVKQSWKLGC